ncbi:hypothetical protein O0I10_002614 [Lichtheimia ornata]|uniref:Uncharacterized protein n=1 Tax=Lichtheimia ornata TaxID=688661 RepID=A0AAD7Y0R1_9FUNG|nr:uncharacterized protein O0I10_002614 [Lichtheimia ornata]KAJ8661805.1 hypothetical protein O0I10_002614 [Lichtheimia ornata]
MASSSPEYLNHVLMRFGHHLSSLEQQSYAKQFSSMIQSSTQGSTLCMKPSSAYVGPIHRVSSSTHRLPFVGPAPVVHQSSSVNKKSTTRIIVNPLSSSSVTF